MSDLDLLFAALVAELVKQSVELKSFDNPAYQNPQSGTPVYRARSPVTVLQKNWTHHSQYSSMDYAWCLQIGSAVEDHYTKFTKVLLQLESIVKESGFPFEKIHDGPILVKNDKELISINSDVGSNFDWIGLRLTAR
jgi:hypothetical protein